MIAERRAAAADRGDLLSMLLLAQDEEDDGGGMTDQQVRDEAMTIFLAGHETTANALTWTWYLSASAPDVEARLHEEVDRVLQGRLPTIADIPSLGFVEQVVTESMRLYPPAWIIGRRAIDDYPLGGYVVAGALARRLSPYLTAARRALLSGSGALRSRSLDAGVQGGAAAVRLLSLRRRAAPVHRRVVRVDGARARRERDRAAVAAAPRARLFPFRSRPLRSG